MPNSSHNCVSTNITCLCRLSQNH